MNPAPTPNKAVPEWAVRLEEAINLLRAREHNTGYFIKPGEILSEILCHAPSVPAVGGVREAVEWLVDFKLGYVKEGIWYSRYHRREDLKAEILAALTPYLAPAQAVERFETNGNPLLDERHAKKADEIFKIVYHAIVDEGAELDEGSVKHAIALELHDYGSNLAPQPTGKQAEGEPDFEAAIKKAVEVGLVPRYDFIDVAAENRDKIKSVVLAALRSSNQTGEVRG